MSRSCVGKRKNQTKRTFSQSVSQLNNITEINTTETRAKDVLPNTTGSDGMVPSAADADWCHLQRAPSILSLRGWRECTARFLSLVTLTFDLDIETPLSEGPNTSSVWIWRKFVQRFPRYLIHKQKKTKKQQKVTAALTTEPYLCSVTNLTKTIMPCKRQHIVDLPNWTGVTVQQLHQACNRQLASSIPSQVAGRQQSWSNCSHLCASDNTQYNLVSARTAGKITAACERGVVITLDIRCLPNAGINPRHGTSAMLVCLQNCNTEEDKFKTAADIIKPISHTRTDLPCECV